MLHDMFLEKEFIGQKLKEYRKKLNISQEKLAEKVGNSYILATVVGKIAKELEKTIPDVIDNSQDKAISIAAKELESGKIIAVNPDKE